MDMNFKGILESLSEASPSHLALASFILLPIVIDYWLQTVLKVFPNLDVYWKIGSVFFILVIYIGCIIWMAYESFYKRKLEVKRDLILGRLTSNNWDSVGFDSLKSSLGDDFTDEAINSIIQSFPKSLRRVRMRVKDKNGNPEKDRSDQPVYKAGVGLVTMKSST